jgi:hypothetical protein
MIGLPPVTLSWTLRKRKRKPTHNTLLLPPPLRSTNRRSRQLISRLWCVTCCVL